MSYSNSYQSNIGIIPSLDAGFQNLTVNSAIIRNGIEPETDSLVDIGRPSKRFRSAYIDDLDMDPVLPATINDIPITVYDNGTRNRYLASKHSLRPIVAASANLATGGMYGVVLNPITRDLIAVGASTLTDLDVYTANIDVDDKVWTRRTLSLYSPTSNAVAPRCVVFDSVNNVYVAFNDYEALEYYTCPSSNPDLWQVVPFASNILNEATTVRGAAFFNRPDGTYGYIFAAMRAVADTQSGLIYSIDGGVSFNVFRPTLTGLESSQTSIWPFIADLVERPDWVAGEIDRFLLLIANNGGNTHSIWCAENIMGPYQRRANPLQSTFLKCILYNPYFKSLAVMKTSTGNLNIYRYIPVTSSSGLPTTLTALTGGSTSLPNNPTSLFPLQNHAYMPHLKTHVYTFRDISTPANIATTTYTWGGNANDFINISTQRSLSSAETGVASAQFVSTQSPWTIDVVNSVGYSIMKKTVSSQTNTKANYSLVSVSFLYPPRHLSSTTNSENALISSSRMIVDKFDRIVSLSTDSVTGGIGSASNPIKSVYFNNNIKSMGSNASIQVRGYGLNNFIGSSNADIGYINPSALGKSIAAFNAVKTRTWGSAVIANVYTEAMVSSSRFVPYLNKMFVIGVNLTGNVEVATLVAGATAGSIVAQPISRLPLTLMQGALPFHQMDIAYSPVYNTLVLSMSSGTAANSYGGSITFYSTNNGATWDTVQYDTSANPVTQYGRVVWIPEMGTHGLFVMFASHLGNGSSIPSQSIMLSEEGIYWRSAYHNTLRGDNDSSSILRSYVSVDYDPSRNLLVNTRRWVSTTDMCLSYSTDGDNWTENDVNAIFNIYTQNCVIRTGVNDKVDFTQSNGFTYAVTLTAGTYIPNALAKEIATRMTAANGGVYIYTGGYNFTTGKFTFFVTPTTGLTKITYQFLFGSGVNVATSVKADIGFSATDGTTGYSQTSDKTIFYSITTTNNRIDLKRTTGAVLYVCYVPPGCYNPPAFATALAAALNLPWLLGGNSVFTVSYSIVNGLFTFASSTAFELLWNSGVNNTINCFAECGFTKVDTASSTSRISTVAQHWDGGLFRACAYSPSLDIWVMAGAGSGATSPTTANLQWSKDITSVSTPGSATSSLAGWTPVSVFLNDGVTRPNFVDVIWAESAQLFFLLNANAGSGSANDRNIWISRDGKSFVPITTASTPKTAITGNQNDTYAAMRLSWDNVNHFLHIGIPHTTFATPTLNEIIYQFSSLVRNEIVPMPGCQYGTFSTGTATPAAGVGSTHSVVFTTPFTAAPPYVIISPFQNGATGVNAQFSWTITAISVTGFDVRIFGVTTSAGGGLSPTFMYLAWESI
jgi:hypothetical protein